MLRCVPGPGAKMMLGMLRVVVSLLQPFQTCRQASVGFAKGAAYITLRKNTLKVHTYPPLRMVKVHKLGDSSASNDAVSAAAVRQRRTAV